MVILKELKKGSILKPWSLKPCPVLVDSKTSADFTEAKISHMIVTNKKAQLAEYFWVIVTCLRKYYN